MEVKVESTITLTINGQKYELTRSDAQQIYNALGIALGNPVGTRDYNNWPLVMPNTIPCSPPNPKWGELYNHDNIKYGTNYEVTCGHTGVKVGD